MNDSLFYDVSQAFLQQQVLDISVTLCNDLQKATQSILPANLTSLYNPILTNFESFRCSDNACQLSKFWNSTNQNVSIS